MLAALLLFSEAAEGGAGPFSVNFGLFFWTWVVFIPLLFILRKFAWPMIVSATEEREQKIERQLAEAEKLNAEAKTVLAEQQRLLAESNGRAQSMITETRQAMERERATALDKVKQEQEGLVDRARREIAAERDKAIAELRREAVDLALGAASKVIGQRVDSDADRKIVLDYLNSTEISH